jgi:hypothetical protein
MSSRKFTRDLHKDLHATYAFAVIFNVFAEVPARCFRRSRLAKLWNSFECVAINFYTFLIPKEVISNLWSDY